MSNFLSTVNPTPFGIFDSDSQFQTDADSMVIFVKRKLGDDILSVELTKKQIWACFEEATLEWGAMINKYQIKSQIASLLGISTGSVNAANLYIRPNLEFLDRQAEAYAVEIGLGGNYQTFSGSIDLEPGRQDYDINTELKNEAGAPLFSLQAPGSTTRLKIFEVFHPPPSFFIFNSTQANNLSAVGFPVESYTADTRFYVLPLFEDVLRAGMLEMATRVRRSNFSYKITGSKIRLFPTPAGTTVNHKLWIRVGFVPDPTNSTGDDTIHGVSSVSNAPVSNIVYSTINDFGKHWIREFALALARETLGLVRDKFKGIPIPNAELTLNGGDLITQGREDQTKAKDTLKEYLESLTHDKIAEMEANRAKSLQEQLKLIPISPQWICRMGIIIACILPSILTHGT